MNGDLATIRDELALAAAGERVVFSSVGPSVVDPSQRAVASAALHLAADQLDIAPPRLQWFEPENAAEAAYAAKFGHRDWEHFPADARLLGVYVEPMREVWVRRGISELETVRTVAHEVAHAVRDGQGRAARERAAEAFADAFESAFTN